LIVPHPANSLLYLKLRDDPAAVQTLTLPVLPANAAGNATPTAPASTMTGAGVSPEKAEP
jgi:hypothetical protein